MTPAKSEGMAFPQVGAISLGWRPDGSSDNERRPQTQNLVCIQRLRV